MLICLCGFKYIPAVCTHILPALHIGLCLFGVVGMPFLPFFGSVPFFGFRNCISAEIFPLFLKCFFIRTVSMQLCMIGRFDDDQIFDLIVPFVFICMVNVMAVRHFPVIILPHIHMKPFSASADFFGRKIISCFFVPPKRIAIETGQISVVEILYHERYLHYR